MKYVKPDVYVEKFVLSDKVAATVCTDAYIDSDRQTIGCLIQNGTEYIFADAARGCKTLVTSVSQLVEYDGSGDYSYAAGYYYVWYDPSSTGGGESATSQTPDPRATAFLAALTEITETGYHIGLATPEIMEAVAGS